MTADGGTVLVAGTTEDRVERVSDWLAGSLPVRTFVTTGGESRPPTDVDVALFADGGSVDDPALETLPAAARCIIVEDADRYEGSLHEGFDRVLGEPLTPDDFRSTMTALVRRARYDRRLRECAELATRCGQLESDGRGQASAEPQRLRKQVADAKAELDCMVAEFTIDDFRRAFQTLAAD